MGSGNALARMPVDGTARCRRKDVVERRYGFPTLEVSESEVGKG